MILFTLLFVSLAHASPKTIQKLKPDEIEFTQDKWAFKEDPFIRLRHWRAPFPTFGLPWPKPHFHSSLLHVYRYRLGEVKFVYSGQQPDILNDIVIRYEDSLKNADLMSEYAVNWRHMAGQVMKMSNKVDTEVQEASENIFHPDELFKLSEDGLHNQVPCSSGTVGLSMNYCNKWSETLANSFFTFMKKHHPSAAFTPLGKGDHLLEELNIHIHIDKESTEVPTFDMNESYILLVRRNWAFLYASQVWGILRGLETLSQLIWTIRGTRDSVFINQTMIVDRPRFPHRGLLFDTSRHFISKEVVMMNLDAMSSVKMNVLHLHLVDDQSFSFQPEGNPEFIKGSYDGRFYSTQDIREITEYARLRGIRVIPEIDMPDHTKSLSKSHPEIFSKCRDFEDNLTGYLGPLDPDNEKTYEVIKKLFEGVLSQFDDSFLHLGGDEVDQSCWELMSSDTHYLERFIKKVHKTIKKMAKEKFLEKNFIYWEEILENRVNIENNSTVQLWKKNFLDFDFSFYENHTINIISSHCWYLDRNEELLWAIFYLCDPEKFNYYNTHKPKGIKVIGGEACMWSEYQNDDTILQRIWPTTLATAERLWSPVGSQSLDKAGPRFEEHTCRLLYRGIPQGSPNGPGFCPKSNGIFSAFLRRNSRGSYEPTLERTLVIDQPCSLSKTSLSFFIIISVLLLAFVLYTRGDLNYSPVTLQRHGHRTTLKFILFIFYVIFSMLIFIIQYS